MRSWAIASVAVTLPALLLVAASAAEETTSTIPRTEMPERIFKILSDAIGSYPFPETVRDNPRQKNAEAIQAMRKLPWPDFEKLELIRLQPKKAPGRPAVVWSLPAKGPTLVLLLPDFTEKRLPAADFQSVEPCRYPEVLAALIERADAADPKKRLASESALVWTLDGRATPYYTASFWVNQAYIAAQFGKGDAAQKLLHAGLRQRRTCVQEAYNEGAWHSFAQGIVLLENGSPRKAVLAQWSQTLRVYGQSDYRGQLIELTAQLEKQAVEDEKLRAADVADPEKLPVEKRIEYYLARLPDVHGQQWSQPGHCMTVGLGAGTEISDALVKIGRPAVPRLIEHLDDRRLTRSIGFSRSFSPHRVVLRGLDVAVQCIEKILDIRFYEPSSTSSYLSNEEAEKRRAVIQDIKSWWKAYGDKPPLDGFLGRLDHGRPYQRLDMLRKAEAIEKKAVNSIAVIKRWAVEGHANDLPEYVRALADRGDRSLLPAIRKMITSDPGRAIPYGAVGVLLRHGDADDYRNLREAARKDMARGSRLGQQQCLWGAVYSSIENTKNPLAVPLLVGFLEQREITGARWLGEAKGSMGFSCADTCMGALIRLTGHNEGYRPDAPPDERFASIDRWRAWWRSAGEAEYLKAHPEVRQVLGPQETETAEVDVAALPAVVDVADPAYGAVHYQVPRAQGTALIQQKKILPSRGAEGPRLRFSSAEAAVEWFAKARPIVPQTNRSARKALEAVEEGGPRRRVVVGPGGREWLWERANVPIAEVKRRVEEGVAGKHASIAGAQVLLVDGRQRVWLIPTADMETLLGYDPAERRWIERRSPGADGPAKPLDTPRDITRCIFTGPGFESRSGFLFFGDQLGVHWFDGAAWGYQRLYQRNIDQNRYYGDIHGFTEPQFAEDAQGRVYVWSAWGQFGRTGTIGFWVFGSGKWRDLDPVERVQAVHPRDPDEVWFVADRGEVSVVKGGKHLAGKEAQQLLHPNLRFSSARLLATTREGMAFLRLDDVTVLEPFAKEPHRGLALPPKGPATDLGSEAGEFLARISSHPVAFDSRGWVWGSRLDGRDPEGMSPDGRQIRAFSLNNRFGSVVIEGAGPEGCVYLRGGGKLWRFDPQAMAQLDDDRPILPAMVIRIQGTAYPDTLGRMWCTWDIPGGPTAVYDGQTWKTFARSQEESRETPGFIAAFQGAGGAMVFVDTRHRFHLFDAEGRATANSAEQLALKYPDRLRRALPYPPAASANYYHHLVKDAAGRIWWANWEKPWGVVDGATALRGEDAEFELGRAHQAVFSVLHPVGDGTRLLAGDERGVSAVVAVQNGRIVSLGPAPVRMGHRPPTNWRRNVLRDSAGRIWVMTNRRTEHSGINAVGGISQAIDSQGNLVATEDGWLMLEDRHKSLWFKLVGWPKKVIVRQDPSGRTASLEVPGLVDIAPFAEAPDGTVWALTSSDLIRLAADGERLSIVSAYPVAASAPGNIWCDAQGRVWLVRGRSPSSYELVCFAPSL